MNLVSPLSLLEYTLSGEQQGEPCHCYLYFSKNKVNQSNASKVAEIVVANIFIEKMKKTK